MLFLEPIEGYEKEFQPEVVGMIRVLAALGFKGPPGEDLARINRNSPLLPIVEKDGKFFYGDELVGYVRAIEPAKNNAGRF